MPFNDDLKKLTALQRPLKRTSIRFIKEDQSNDSAHAHPTAKAVYCRLKETFEPGSWELHTVFCDNFRHSTVTIRLHLFGQWIELCASADAEESQSDDIASIFETALSKAGLLWGIGEYLQD